jgi:hypothetical protein
VLHQRSVLSSGQYGDDVLYVQESLRYLWVVRRQ